MEPRLEGRIPRRGTKAERGSTGGIRVTPLHREWISQVHESLSFASFTGCDSDFALRSAGVILSS
jgi:hypothetical protein